MGAAYSKNGGGGSNIAYGPNGPLCVPRHDMDFDARMAQLERARKDYVPCHDAPAGKPTDWILAYPKTVPKCEDVNAAPDAMMRLTGMLGKLQGAFWHRATTWHASVLRGYHKGPFERHRHIVSADPPRVARDDAWRDDYEWGYQRLNGLMPILVRRCDAIPESMAAQLAANSGAALAGLLPPGESLEDLVRAKRIFIVDHTDLVGCPHHKDRYLCPSRTLFLATGEKDSKAPALPGETIPPGPRFRPIAIQLEPKADVPVITPVHPAVPGLWLATRLHAGVSDAAQHLYFEHVATTHLCNEAFWLCMCRTMADQHPLKQIVKPHMKLTIYMGAQFRMGTWLNPKGSLPNLMSCGLEGGLWIIEKKLKTWKMTDHDQSRYYKERGTDELEGYTMRDDAIAHWDLIVKYCRRVVDLVYHQQPIDILNDAELQDFVHELRETGHFNGVPGDADGRISKAEDVALLLAIPIFAGAVKHSLVDNCSNEYFGYAPNTPLSFYLEPPVSRAAIQRQVDKGGYTDEVIANALPQGVHAVQQYAMSRANYPVHPDTGRFDKFVSLIGKNGDAWANQFAGTDFQQALNKWATALASLERKIDIRNLKLQPRPFTLLKPSDMSNSVWV